MTEITRQQLENASTDAASLEAIVNGAASPGIHTTRLGQIIKTLAKIMADLESSALSDKFLFDTVTTMGDPGTGDIRFNNATIASVTAIAFSALSAMTGNPNVRNLINSWDDTTTNPRATIMIRKLNSPSTFAVFNINNSITDNTSWLQIPVTYITGNGTFANGDQLYVSVSRAGLAGAGDMTGPGVSNDNRIVRMDGTTGKVVQQSSVTLDDSGNFSGVAEVQFTNTTAKVAPTSTGFDLYSSNGSVVAQVRNNAFAVTNSGFVVDHGSAASRDDQFRQDHTSGGGNILFDWFKNPASAGWIKLLYGRSLDSAAAIKEQTMIGFYADAITAGAENGRQMFFTRQAGIWANKFNIAKGLTADGRTDFADGTINANELYVLNQKVMTPVQIVNAEVTATTTGTTIIPFDNTIPQNTEGNEYMSLAITPKFSNSLLEIDVVINASCSVAALCAAALFWDSNANAICTFIGGRDAGAGYSIAFKYVVAAGSTTLRTYKVRVGMDRAGTTTFNPYGFGGTSVSRMTIKEFRQ